MIGSNRRTQAADHQLNPDSHNTKSRRYSANYGPCRIRALNLSLMTDYVCFGCLRGGCGMMVGVVLDANRTHADCEGERNLKGYHTYIIIAPYLSPLFLLKHNA